VILLCGCDNGGGVEKAFRGGLADRHFRAEGIHDVPDVVKQQLPYCAVRESTKALFQTRSHEKAAHDALERIRGDRASALCLDESFYAVVFCHLVVEQRKFPVYLFYLSGLRKR